MAFNEKLSYTEHNVTSPTSDFTIGFEDYAVSSKDRINVTVDGVAAEDAGYTVTRKNSLVVQLTPPVSAGVVRLQRETNIDAPFHRFSAGAKFVAANVDQNFTQILHSQQEVNNGFAYTVDYLTNTLNAYDNRIKKVEGIVGELDDRLDQEIKDRIQGDLDNRRYTEDLVGMGQIWDGISSRSVWDYPRNLNQEQINTLLGIDSGIKTWSERTQEAKNKDSVHVEDFRTYLGVVFDDQTTATRAIAYCKENKRVLDWEGVTLTSTANLVGFWDVTHKGHGKIVRGLGLATPDTFYITPKSSYLDTETTLNIQYVAPTGGLTANDGISAEYPIAIGSIISRIQNMAQLSLYGQWRFQFLAGTFTSNGIRWNDVPTFHKTLQFYGVEATSYVGLTTIWKSPNGSNVYAIRAENTAEMLIADFKYMRFEGWSSSSNSGGLLSWNPCRIKVDTCAFVNCAMGVAIRYGYLRVTNSLFEDNITWGVSGAYQSTTNVGNLNGGGNVFRRSGVDCSRTSIMYIQGNEFIECTNPITCSRVSRIRTQGNTFTSWYGSAISMDLNSAYTPDNSAGYPEIIVQTPSKANPFYKSATNSSHLLIERIAGGRHLTSSTAISLQGEANTPILFNNLSSEWSPYRIPSYVLYGDCKMTVTVWFRCQAGSGGILELHGQGYSVSSLMAQLNIPVVTSQTDYVVTFETIVSGDSTALVRVNCPKLNIDSTTSLAISSSAFRSASEDPKLFRFYFTPANAEGSVSFRHFESRVFI